MRIYSFEKLDTWQKARIFRKEIYILIRKFPKEEIYGLTSQIKRSASSIGDCLAEGSARITAKDKAHYITMAYSSAIETVNHIIGAHDLEYIEEEEYIAFRLKLDELTNKLNALRNAILKDKA
ncbi:four helix bundle protein [Pedobacter punctiformis]|uniref:Four helix bundle protein n=1 Tax=Pedobacter punctiformis TaxID=3004097 RepID=A0ABT4LBX6_9SPHI|nr:four helix bundle protein [Pedobacter sp. HCMS5-2]MCZ4245393.1 four helix bundle protein [Pedobacter sp. HCMS5-2]